MENELPDNKLLLQKLRRYHIADINMTRLFFVLLLTFFVIAMIPSLRPSYSQTERRELERFPKFSFASFTSGEYFDKINLWFSDTFPFRDQLVTLNGYLTGFSGGRIQLHGEVETGDEIPEIPVQSDSADSDSADSDSSAATETQTETESTQADASQNSAEAESSEPPQPAVPAVEQLGAVLVIDDSAYEYYNFIQATADSYAAYVSRAADLLAGRATVYDMIVPTSMAITALPDIAAGVNTSDQRKAIDYMYGRMSGNVRCVNVFDTLYDHRSEYIYFRTDHHWTALGAYYAYDKLMAARGVAATPLDSFIPHEFPGFLGSFYADSGKNPRLAANPDVVFAYEPPQTNIVTTYLQGGGVKDYHIISDGNLLGPSNKYLSFVSGDRPLGVIVNPDAPEGTVCTVIKESFGNAFVPFLVGNYRTVYVVDYRYIGTADGRQLSQFVDETGTTEVLFINNISATRNKSLVASIGGYVG